MNAETYDRYRRTLLSEGFSGAGNYWYRDGRRYTLHGALAVNRWQRMTVTLTARMDRFTKAMQRAGRAARRAEKILYLQLYKPAAYRNLPNVRYYRLQKRRMLAEAR